MWLYRLSNSNKAGVSHSLSPILLVNSNLRNPKAYLSVTVFWFAIYSSIFEQRCWSTFKPSPLYSPHIPKKILSFWI
jgi:hypothetical protein